MYFKGFTPNQPSHFKQRGGKGWIVICNSIYEMFYQDAQDKKAGPIKNPAFIALNSFLV